MGIEETYRKRLDGVLRGIRMGTKDPENNEFYTLLNRFKKINPELADDYQDEYIKLVQGNKKLVS